MVKRRKIYLTIATVAQAISLLFFLPALAYDEKTTHPALTDEMVDFFNLSFPERTFTAEEKEWIIQGSIDEDLWPRWTNHFYDPVRNEGWSAEEFGWLSPQVALVLNKFLLSNFPPITSKSWIQSPDIQSKYKQFGGNRTWQRAIYELAINDNKKEAYYTLGHALHLLEDASVPDHTRNDTHAHPLESITGDYGSPYEEYDKRFKRTSGGTNIPNTAESLFQIGSRPILRPTLNNYFDTVANYSNNYFFSKDTISADPLANSTSEFNRKYKLPSVIEVDNEFGYGKDRGGEKFKLVKITQQWNKQTKSYNTFYDLSDKPSYHPILDAYFSRLSREAVVNGAGVIKLFFDEVEKVKRGEMTIEPPPDEKFGVWSVLTVVKPVKEVVVSTKDAVVNGVYAIGNKISVTLGSAYNTVKSKLGIAPPARSEQGGEITSPSPSPSQGEGTRDVLPSVSKITVVPKPDVNKVEEKKPVTKPPVKPVSVQKAPAKVLGEQIVAPQPVVTSPSPSPSPSEGEGIRTTIPAQTTAPVTSFGFSGGSVFSGVGAPASETSPQPSPSQGEGAGTPAPVVPQQPVPPPDTTPPGVPALDSVFADVLFTTSTSVTIFGVNATDTVKILAAYAPDAQTAPVSPPSQGGESETIPATSSWTVNSILNPGYNYFYFSAADAVFNTSTLSLPAVLVLDTAPPPAPAVTVTNQTTAISTNVRIALAGEDALSPVTWYDVEYGVCRDVACNVSTTTWAELILNTTSTEFDFTAARGQTYAFRARARDMLENVSDWSANNAAPTFVNWSGEVVINEVAWAGTAAQYPNDEWIELYNNTGAAIDLTGWKILVGGRPLNFSRVVTTTIPARGYFLLERTRDEAVLQVSAGIVYTGAMNNGGEKIELIKPNGEKADEVDCSGGWFAGDNVKYRSMERVNSAGSGNERSNWQSNKSPRLLPRTFVGGQIYGSPKQANRGFFSLIYQQEEPQVTLTPEGNPYLLQFYEVPAGYTLTIEPGVVIKAVWANSGMDIKGRLITHGTSEKPVVFTSGRDQSFGDPLLDTVAGAWSGATPAAEDWRGLWFKAGSAGELNGFHLRYGGKEFRTPFNGWVSQALRADNATLAISNSSFTANTDSAISLNASLAAISGSSFTRGDRALEAIDSALTVSATSFKEFTNARGPIRIIGRWPEFDDLIFENNALNLPLFDNVTIYTDAVVAAGSAIYASVITVSPTATLKIEPGAGLYFTPFGSLIVKGTLEAIGTPEAPIVFDGIGPTGHWSNILFTNATGTFRHVRILHGNHLVQRPAHLDGMLVINNSQVTLEQCVVSDPWENGNIIQSVNSQVSLKDCAVNQSVPPRWTTIGIKASGGVISLDNIAFSNLSIGLFADGQPAPPITVSNMGRGNFTAVRVISQPASWIEPLLGP